MASYSSKMVKKSRTWHSHGGYAPQAMRIYEEQVFQTRRRRRQGEWFPSVRDLFKK